MTDSRDAGAQLPPGYHAQAAWGLLHRTGRWGYEFNRVYGPPDLHDRRGPICQLDEDLSYWSLTGVPPGDGAEGMPARLTYAEARRRAAGRLTFARFSSLVEMRETLPGLLRGG